MGVIKNSTLTKKIVFKIKPSHNTFFMYPHEYILCAEYKTNK